MAGEDILDMDYINSLPQPLWDGEWPVYDIEVQTGLYRIDVCGLLEVKHIDRCHSMRDAMGVKHYTGDFYLDEKQWESRGTSATLQPTKGKVELCATITTDRSI